MEQLEWLGLPILENYPYSHEVLQHNGQFAVYSPTLEAYLPPECKALRYWGTDEWDAPRNPKKIFGKVDESILKYVNDYKLNLILH